MARTPSGEVALEIVGAPQRYVNAAQGLPQLSDLEFVLFEKTPPDKAAAAILTRAQGPSHPMVR
jgi:hypothetical protein